MWVSFRAMVMKHCSMCLLYPCRVHTKTSFLLAFITIWHPELQVNKFNMVRFFQFHRSFHLKRASSFTLTLTPYYYYKGWLPRGKSVCLCHTLYWFVIFLISQPFSCFLYLFLLCCLQEDIQADLSTSANMKTPTVFDSRLACAKESRSNNLYNHMHKF